MPVLTGMPIGMLCACAGEQESDEDGEVGWFCDAVNADVNAGLGYADWPGTLKLG